MLRGCKRRSAEGARLVEAMIWQERDRRTRCDAIAVLSHISPHAEAVARTFAEVQKDRDAEVRATVPDALGQLGLSPKAQRTSEPDHPPERSRFFGARKPTGECCVTAGRSKSAEVQVDVRDHGDRQFLWTAPALQPVSRHQGKGGPPG